MERLEFVDLLDRIDEHAVRDLLSLSVGNPSPTKLGKISDKYANEPGWALFGLEQEGQLIGLIGTELTGAGELRIHHISVVESERGRGYGHRLINEVCHKYNARTLISETDSDAVGFYEKYGFNVRPLGSQPGRAERFLCSFSREVNEY